MNGSAAEQLDMLSTVRFYPAEREVFRRRVVPPTSEWAEESRTVTTGAHIGPWRNDISPHLVGIMDVIDLPYVRECAICKSPQTGGTEVIYNHLGKCTEHDPGPALIVMPSQKDARKVSEDRIIPMFRQSPGLRPLISDNPDDTAKERVALANGAILYMGWSNSSSSLATFAIKYVYYDERDKSPERVRKETDPGLLVRKRMRAFTHTSKFIEASTPTEVEGPIWKALKAADAEYHFFAVCPDCACEQTFKLGQLKFPDETDKDGKPVHSPAAIRRDLLARYDCEGCGGEWTDRKRNKAVQAGRWKRVRGADILRPRTVSFHLPSWLSSDVSLSEIAEAYLLSKHDKLKLIDFHNDYLAEPFIESEEGETVHEELLYARRHDYAPKGATWQVPMAACVLTCFVDVQKNRLEAGIEAWGPGMESWDIDYRVFLGDPITDDSVWAALEEYRLRKWTHESGAKLHIPITGIDSGHAAPRVYSFVRRRSGVYACKGASTRGKPLITISSRQRHGKKKRLLDRHGVTLINIGTEVAKDAVYARLQVDEPGPGYIHFPMARGLDHFRQLTAEHRIIKYDKASRPYTTWEEKHRDAPNEAWDIKAGNYAMVELLNPNFERLAEGLRTGASPAQARAKKGRTVRSRGASR